MTLDDGLFPKSDQSRIRWEGMDRSVINCLARVPIDVARPESFLSLCRAFGESMDRDHVATMVFAHWPGGGCTWYEDLRRATRHCDCFGKFITRGIGPQIAAASLSPRSAPSDRRAWCRSA